MRRRQSGLPTERPLKLLIYAVRDRATDQFGNPMFLVSSGQAIRSFTDEINRAEANNMMYTHPDDFDLYALGEYDTEVGEFKTERPRQITVGKEVKIRESK